MRRPQSGGGCASASGGASAGIRARPDCSQAETITLRQCAMRFSVRPASSFTSVRSASTGRRAATPSSVAFCRIRSIFRRAQCPAAG